jgi:hypothetical protein
VKSLHDAAIDGNCQAARETREAVEGKSNVRIEAAGSKFEILVRYANPPKLNDAPNDASSDPNASQDVEKGSK